MLIYITGPMSNIPEFNFPAFAEAASRLRSAAFEVISPHEISLSCGCSGPVNVCSTPHTWNDYMRSDITQLLTAQAVAFLPGHHDSRGATLEITIARALGMAVLSVETWLAGSRVRRDAPA